MARKPEIHPLLSTIKTFVVLNVRSSGQDRDLSQRQIAVFLCIATEDDVEHTIRGLADRLQISKPAITRAVDRLEDFELVRRNIDGKDRRSVIVTRTSEGTAYLRGLSKLAQTAERN